MHVIKRPPFSFVPSNQLREDVVYRNISTCNGSRILLLSSHENVCLRIALGGLSLVSKREMIMKCHRCLREITDTLLS